MFDFEQISNNYNDKTIKFVNVHQINEVLVIHDISAPKIDRSSCKNPLDNDPLLYYTCYFVHEKHDFDSLEGS
jgi:2-polyprenyl-3-methyl-5-hydroxy-6-metoxy-1,4-benzoquinol methylase